MRYRRGRRRASRHFIGLMTKIENRGELAPRIGERLQHVANRPSEELLMGFCKLPAKHNWAVAIFTLDILQRFYYPVRRLIKHDDAPGDPEVVKPPCAVF